MTHNTFKITYIMTGSGEKQTTSSVQITTGDTMNSGKKILTFDDIINAFEEIAAENWKTYENRNAIVKMEIVNTFEA